MCRSLHYVRPVKNNFFCRTISIFDFEAPIRIKTIMTCSYDRLNMHCTTHPLSLTVNLSSS